MKIVIPGGSGQVGQLLNRALLARNHEVVVLSRHGTGTHAWDGKTLGSWAQEIDGADVIINLAGRSVNCRYTDKNLNDMLLSRVESTRVVGQAIAQASSPPKLWLQMSTATIYAHRFDAVNDEYTGIICGQEPEVPNYWGFSVDLAKAWEAEQENAQTPKTRKIALRTAMVMSPDKGGIFSVLKNLTRVGLGGSLAGGDQYVSWIHETDFVRAILFLIENEAICGAVNLTSPSPLPQRDFMASLCKAMNKQIALPATKWMLEIGAFFMRTDTELLLKSRRVVPSRLLDAGFTFEQATWPAAAEELVSRTL